MRIIQSEHPRPLTLLAVGANGRVAAAGDAFSVEGALEVWDATTGTRLPSPPAPGQLAALAFATDGSRLVFGAPGGLTFGDTRVEYPFNAPTFALYPGGERAAVASNYPLGVVECWRFGSMRTYSRVWCERLGDLHRCEVPAADPTGTRIAVAERYEGNDGRPRQDVTLRDAETGKATVRIPLDPADPVRQLAFTADGARLLVRTDSRAVQMFDAATGAPAGELVHPRRPYVTAVAVHPYGEVACARTDGTVTFWDAEAREPIRTLDWKAGKLVSLAFAPDGALAAAGTEDGKVVVWDVDV